MPARDKKIDVALQFANELLKTKRTDVHQLELGLNFPTLSSASWQTAERTGALAPHELCRGAEIRGRLFVSGIPGRSAPPRD